MQIITLGTRREISASAPYHSKRSDLLVDDTLMLDLGEEEFLGREPDYIIILKRAFAALVGSLPK